jgi:hypothetical protein
MSTISTTFRRWRIPGHPQVFGKQATTTFTCEREHLPLGQVRPWLLQEIGGIGRAAPWPVFNTSASIFRGKRAWSAPDRAVTRISKRGAHPRRRSD